MSEIFGEGAHLLFDIGAPEGGVHAQGFALPVIDVSQVIDAEGVSLVPGAPALIEGIANHRGRILTVVDPGPMITDGIQPDPVSLVVLLRRRRNNVGLKIAATQGIVTGAVLAPSQVTPGPFVSWVAQMEERLVSVLDADALMQAIESSFESFETAQPETQGVSP